MLAKLVNAHGGTHRELPEVQQVFAALRSELEPHMFKEEQVLFPAIRRLEQSDTQPTFPFGTVSNPIRMMELEHEVAGNALARIRELTCDYAVPTDACNTYRAALDGLRALELDMHRHVHKENSILFPRAVERERAISTLHASR
jgi:regulator of cell morphogenesis and NO signaling